MPDINYFDQKYSKEAPRKENEFGIGDNGNLAFTTLVESEKIAYVSNGYARLVQFIPIDHNVIVKDNNGNECSQCDGMLHVAETKDLIFVELKTKGKKWIPEAIAQLESTINHFASQHTVSDFKYRRAYAANSQHPHFNYSMKEACAAFHTRTKFRLNIMNKIVLK